MLTINDHHPSLTDSLYAIDPPAIRFNIISKPYDTKLNDSHIPALNEVCTHIVTEDIVSDADSYVNDCNSCDVQQYGGALQCIAYVGDNKDSAIHLCQITCPSTVISAHLSIHGTSIAYEHPFLTNCEVFPSTCNGIVTPTLSYGLIMFLQICSNVYGFFSYLASVVSDISVFYAEWANTVSMCMFASIHQTYIFSRPTSMLIQRLCILSRRNFLKRHDFAAIQLPFNHPVCMAINIILLISLISYLPVLEAYKPTGVLNVPSLTGAICRPVSSPTISKPIFSMMADQALPYRVRYRGGGNTSTKFNAADIAPFAVNNEDVIRNHSYRFILHGTKDLLEDIKPGGSIVLCKIPLSLVVPKLTIPLLLSLAKQLEVPMTTRWSKSDMVKALSDARMHTCQGCITAFEPAEPSRATHSQGCTSDKDVFDNKFPPLPPTQARCENVIKCFTDATSPKYFEESGCAICGELSPMLKMKNVSETNIDLNILIADGRGFTRKERRSSLDPIAELDGPIIDQQCKYICKSCLTSLKRKREPKFALSRGLWIGEVPPQLKCLRYFERLLIARVRHNRCIFRVSMGSSNNTGMSKMIANAITFQQPVQKVYAILPPPVKEMDDVVAFIFTGPNQPTQEDYNRTPLLVRRRNVLDALEWLKLNHRDYADLEISLKNLEEYPEDVPPVVVDYRHRETNKLAEATSVHDTELDDGTVSGLCPLTVHGITGEQYADASTETLKTVAMEHLTDMGKFLAVGRAENPESTWKNPALYPQMFPWLFPYGLGGVGDERHKGRMSDAAHKRHLLMYHDKRFQTDHEFCLIAFNHEQIKDATTGGFLMTEKHNFHSVADRLVNIDPEELKTISKRMVDGEKINPVTDGEKACFDILKDVDHVGGHVDGSITNKRYMRNEIWSLSCFRGAPSWYITLSPADNKHPISMYLADTDSTFKPMIRTDDEKLRLISENPVAGARFFHFMISAFIEHVLGVREFPRKGLKRNCGLFGKTSAYYGTVEQQGRLTLHLHMVIWIINSLTPQEIRDRIMDDNSTFQKKMVEYLEGVHMGEFLTGSHQKVQQIVNNNMIQNDYVSPTETLPAPPPLKCKKTVACGDCAKCIELDNWRDHYRDTVDDILLRSNVHTCRGGPREYQRKHNRDRGKSRNSKEKFNPVTGCKSNKWGKCKARFPRKVFEQTMVNPMTGSLDIKKGEPWMNTVNPVITYLLRCNTDITSLLSGTAIKAVLAYISDYITKPTLKTYVVFDTIVSIFEKNSELINGPTDRKETARRLLTQIVNSLTAKMEVGAPMAAMYLLGNPDHYTDHKFRTFYWRSYVFEARRPWMMDVEDQKYDKVMIRNKSGQLIAVTTVQDYTFRPVKYDDMTLYDWIRLHNKKPKPKARKRRASNTKLYPAEPQINNSDDDLSLTSDTESMMSDFIVGGGNSYVDMDIDGISDCASSSENMTVDNTSSDLDSFIDDSPYSVSTSKTLNAEYNEVMSECETLVDSDINSDCESNEADEYSDNDSLDDDGQDNYEDEDSDVVDDCYEPVDTKTFFSFMDGHPSYDTHHVNCLMEEDSFVPNFVGGILPRSDQGDREYYCSTMLTLFKPWRHGRDLRNDKESWDEAFVRMSFKPRQQELMKFFNLRYECMDARDDFHAELRKGDGEYPCEGTDDYAPDNGYDAMSDNDELDGYEHDRIHVGRDMGKRTRMMNNKMESIENIMRTSGWFDKSPDGLPEYENLERVKPSTHLPPKEWEKKVGEKKEQALHERMSNCHSTIASSNSADHMSHVTNDVQIVDKSYLEYTYKPKKMEDNQDIDSTIHDFKLNSAQEKAFRIITNHAVSKSTDQLKMYLGGMGGTGKSRVIKAVVAFFEKRKEAHRILILAPTGSAAALLTGYTYHSALAINDNFDFGGAKNVAQVRDKLDGVDYIFLDEVSMLSCHDMYRICAQLAKAFNVHDKPFGGKNIVFSGDFAQLPPVGGRESSSLYSGSIGAYAHSRLTVYNQESAIGKALWHQVTTVVILRENMRQKQQTEDDAKFRTALENMRYKDCTADDIAFLRTRIAGPADKQPKLAEKKFRNISIITAWNAQKDRINTLGTTRFAEETGQVLEDFYSHDTWAEYEPPKEGKGKRKRRRKVKYTQTSTNIPEQDQIMLWNLEHNATDHIPGKLTLCVGLPIMIRYNTATELCITKGQEGTVAGWDSSSGPYGRQILETLFVKLTDPPKSIHFEGLPLNVVPIVKIASSVNCRLVDDQVRRIDRLQIPILPNFAMTDYASQGKTRPNNVVDLTNCSSHQSYYTALSRSATAAGTCIIQSFSPRPITGGASGWLRQEFRELEMLDDMTTLIYKSRLPKHINGETRNVRIKQYRDWKGHSYVPKHVHKAISWSLNSPYVQMPTEKESTWKLIERKKATSEPTFRQDLHLRTAIGSVPVRGIKRKADDDDCHNVGPAKKLKPNHSDLDSSSSGPMGLVWDNTNWSCAYDSLFTILYYVWTTNPHKWNRQFVELNSTAALFANSYQKVYNSTYSAEHARDMVREHLHNRDQNTFPYGRRGTVLADVIREMLSSTHGTQVWTRCLACNVSSVVTTDAYIYTFDHIDNRVKSTSELVRTGIKLRRNLPPCAACGGQIDRSAVFEKAPRIVSVLINPAYRLKVDRSVKIMNHSGRNTIVHLRGLIYFEDFHFVCRVVDAQGRIWYNDGKAMGRISTMDGTLRNTTNENILKRGTKTLVAVLYAQT